MKKDVVIFPDDPYEQKLIAAHDAIISKCRKQEEEEKRRRAENGDATALSLIVPIQFFENEKDLAIVNTYLPCACHTASDPLLWEARNSDDSAR